MMLYFPEPTSGIAVNVRSKSRELRLRVVKDKAERGELHALVVLGDGSPDDVAVALIARHLNGGARVVAVVKPEKTREQELPKHCACGSPVSR